VRDFQIKLIILLLGNHVLMFVKEVPNRWEKTKTMSSNAVFLHTNAISTRHVSFRKVTSSTMMCKSSCGIVVFVKHVQIKSCALDFFYLHHSYIPILGPHEKLEGIMTFYYVISFTYLSRKPHYFYP
jgi:hypothetical protein